MPHNQKHGICSVCAVNAMGEYRIFFVDHVLGDCLNDELPLMPQIYK